MNANEREELRDQEIAKRTKFNRLKLIKACELGEIEIIKELIDYLHFSIMDDCLNLAIKNNDIKVFEILVEDMIDWFKSNLNVLLIKSINLDKIEITEYIFNKFNVSLEVKNNALNDAFYYKNEEAINYLLLRGADINSVTKDNKLKYNFVIGKIE